MSIEYSTDHFLRGERFSYWRDVICDAYLPISCETPEPAQFQGKIALQRLSKIDISHVTGSPQRVARGRQEISRDTDAFFMLSLQKSHSGIVTQSGRTARLNAGDFAVYSTETPYEISCENDVDQLVLQIPQADLLRRVPHVDMITGLRVDARSAVGALVSTQLQQCVEVIGTQDADVQLHLQDALVDLVATGLSSLSSQTVQLSKPKQLVLSRAKSLIRSHLMDSRLDRGFLAELMGMSPRNLSRLFEQDGTSIAAFIRKSRMDAIAQDLVDPRLGQISISEIAMKWGLTNFQHVSKLFKQTYGMSPRAFRRAKLTNI